MIAFGASPAFACILANGVLPSHSAVRTRRGERRLCLLIDRRFGQGRLPISTQTRYRRRWPRSASLSLSRPRRYRLMRNRGLN
jgi:hypothetical protein